MRLRRPYNWCRKGTTFVLPKIIYYGSDSLDLDSAKMIISPSAVVRDRPFCERPIKPKNLCHYLITYIIAASSAPARAPSAVRRSTSAVKPPPTDETLTPTSFE